MGVLKKDMWTRFTPEEAAQVDRVRGHLTRAEFLRRAALSVQGIEYGVHHERPARFVEHYDATCDVCDTPMPSGIYVQSRIGEPMFVCHRCQWEW